MEELTTKAEPSLRRGFVDLAAAMEQKQAVNHTTQYKKDKDYEVAIVASMEARKIMQRKLIQHIGLRAGGGQGPRPHVPSAITFL